MAINVASRVMLLGAGVIAASGGRAGKPVPMQVPLRVDDLATSGSGQNATAENQSVNLAGSARVDKPKFGKIRRVRGARMEKGAKGGFNPDQIHKLPCGTSEKARSDDKKEIVCPPECPYWAQDLDDDRFCTFKCVPAQECGINNPRRPIADFTPSGHKVCRGPIVANCRDYRYDGTDSCLKCQFGYYEGEDGQCISKYNTVFLTIAVVLLLALAPVAVWFIVINCKPITNKLGLKQGHAARSQAKVSTSFNTDMARSTYPVPLTNLCKNEDVAGPGMLLHFNFQFVCMLWAFGMAFIWWAFVKNVDEDMFVLGTRNFGTPRENCILVAWGYETQQRLMWAKVSFLVMAYLFTFIGSILYSIRQHRMCDDMDAEQKTMKDFVARIEGIPDLKGDADVEQQISAAVSKATGKKVIGVSVCWNYGEDETVKEKVDQAIEEDLVERQQKYFRNQGNSTVEGVSTSNAPELYTTQDPDVKGPREGEPASGIFLPAENYVVTLACGEPPEKLKSEEIIEMLKSIEVGQEAFVVFDTEDARDEAVDTAEANGGIQFGDTKLPLVTVECEPDTVNWENLGSSTPKSRAIALVKGFGYILCGLAAWATLFYGPYFYGQITFNYENGAMPPGYTGLIFTLVVCVGNVIMYEVCARVSDAVGFKTKDEREACYMVMYVIACSFNVILDFVCTYMVALKVARGMNFRTYFGVKIDDIESFTEQFETYAMQRILAQNAFDYAWPSTFLIPFLLEPIVTVYVPYKISQLMVRTHAEWTGRDAELWLACIPFDMGRYGDLQLNMLLGLMIFFFPSGYTLTLFLGMAFSHMYIYCFDHWKVLSAIPFVIYANGNVDWYSQWLLAPITAVLAACLAFKANGEGLYEVKGMAIVVLCTFAFIAHTVVHTLLLIHVVPKFQRNRRDLEDPNKGMDYKAMATKLAANWFTANPVHCLRSKYIKKDSPSCSFIGAAPMHLGKEHLMNYNEKIGCFFKDQPAEVEDYDSCIDWKAFRQLYTGGSTASKK